ncbi:AraC family transcriptional regulator [Kaistia algarum]|uniref:AraC family transcriptional regulator n=1 Tax=Kaistia algarum TaxID=2083279 RepID=UPI0022578A18|nr:AraC family transcriptional regulator [Kaistia algarum]MCX5516718.1 AraC family transcriptional regulator [Kaistia algarum]
MRDLGVDPAEVAAEAGIDLALLADQESQIPFRAACLLARIAAERTGCDHIGLLVAAREGSDTRSIGAVGALMRNAPTLGRALLDICENHHRYVRGGVPYLVARDDSAWLGYSIYENTGASVDHFQVGALAVGLSMAKELCGARPDEVLLSRKAPADPQPYRQFFRAPVTFDADQSALVFSRATLALPVVRADPAKRRALETQVRDYWAVDLPNISDQVVRLLRPRVLFMDDRLASVANALAMHPRVLERALQAEGTSFRALLKQTQIDVAKRLMTGTRLSITAIGAALGYADTSAFSNAFRRMTGQSPRAWRAGNF